MLKDNIQTTLLISGGGFLTLHTKAYRYYKVYITAALICLINSAFMEPKISNNSIMSLKFPSFIFKRIYIHWHSLLLLHLKK